MSARHELEQDRIETEAIKAYTREDEQEAYATVRDEVEHYGYVLVQA